MNFYKELFGKIDDLRERKEGILEVLELKSNYYYYNKMVWIIEV